MRIQKIRIQTSQERARWQLETEWSALSATWDTVDLIPLDAVKPAPSQNPAPDIYLGLQVRETFLAELGIICTSALRGAAMRGDRLR